MTTVVGSMPQPDWLLDKGVLRSQRVPRVRQPGLWRIGDDHLNEAILDATRLAILDMEEAGIDIITDGEIGRESYSNHFLASLDGVDVLQPAIIQDRKGRDVQVPRVTGPISRRTFCEQASAKSLLALAKHQTKVTLPGPFTLAQQCHDEFYGDAEALAFAFADAVNEEARDLAALGIDVVQLDEPWLRNDPELARRCGVALVDRALRDVSAKTAIHMCFGYGFLVPGSKPRTYDYLAELADSAVDQISIEAAQPDLDLGVLRALQGKTIILGVLNLASDAVETVEEVVARIRAGLDYVEPANLMPAPDCGMKYLSRSTARAKLKVLADAASEVKRSLGITS
ncbi:MAG: 5-methyltetrahydropteroyltriglutamate--homocysteine methyltransferase [Pseudomonadota bacterium]